MIIKKLLLFAFFLGTIPIYSQQAVQNSGNNATSAGGSISYSVGQVAYTENSSATGSVAQGVQQAFEVLLGVDQNEISLQLKMYPNPTVAVLNLSFGEFDMEGVTYSIIDLSGKQIIKPTVANIETTINIENFSAATYLLTISKNNKPLKIYKIVKN